MALPLPDQIVQLIATGGRRGRAQIEEAASGADDVDRLCVAEAQAEDPRVRAIICQILATLGDPHALPCLLRALDDPDEPVVAAAADAIGNCAYDKPISPDLRQRLERRLLDLLTDAASPRSMRTGAQYALGLLRSCAAVPALVDALGDDEPIVRWNSAEALGHIGDTSALPAVRSRLAVETHPRVLQLLKAANERLTDAGPPG